MVIHKVLKANKNFWQSHSRKPLTQPSRRSGSRTWLHIGITLGTFKKIHCLSPRAHRSLFNWLGMEPGHWYFLSLWRVWCADQAEDHYSRDITSSSGYNRNPIQVSDFKSRGICASHIESHLTPIHRVPDIPTWWERVKERRLCGCQGIEGLRQTSGPGMAQGSNWFIMCFHEKN